VVVPCTLTIRPNSTWITLSTAHPAKFSSAVELALSSQSEFSFDRDVLPPQLKELESMEKRIHKVQGEQGVRDLVEKVRGDKAAAKLGKGSI
jgi:threonine synthase